MANSFEIPYTLRSYHQLSDSDKYLANEAEDAMKNAHAPYSNFNVGCAIQLADDAVFTGSNQENAAYPSGLCAERVALFKVGSETRVPIKTIIVAARNEAAKTADAFSCGSCRQVMMEYASLQQDPIRIMMRRGDGGYVVVEDVRLLLPFGFDANTLNS